MAAMYEEFFGLTESPFSIAPDPRYLYMSERHREALAHLMYGLNSNGAFILLTGDVGTGKTTVSRCLLDQIPEQTKVALVLNPKVSALELLETICDELYGRHGAPHTNLPPGRTSIKVFIDIINHYLLQAHAEGRKTVLLIEEAQNLDLDVLEQLRLLTNLETNDSKLLQIILLGQPELLEVLDRPELSQLAQRITARYHLGPLNQDEMIAYVQHRLAVAGGRQPLFSRQALQRLYQLSQGIPRLINVLCDRALLGAYVQNKPQVDARTLSRAAEEVLGPRARSGRPGRPWPVLGVAAGLLLAVAVAVLMYYRPLADAPLQVEQTPSEALPAVAETVVETVPEVVETVTAAAVESMPSDEALPVVSDSLNWPDESGRLRSNSLAYQSVFRQWKLEYRPEQDGSPCFYAQTRGMGCHEETSNLEKLRNLNRPVVLKLHDAHNRTYYAALTGLGSQVARIELAGEEQTVAVNTVYRHWDGEFTLLWQQPPTYHKPITPGAEGEDVYWLSQKLRQIDSRDPVAETPVYQPAMIEKIKRFQLDQGLIADGIVGVHTLVRLNNELGVDAPRLLKDKS
jgi:general secretion pathway protein A